ncbi:MAG: ABC transporter substrate-binding protein [Dehalococcoidia bacterium]|nr:ABC transporter substrate-binding protein [Dehalococcoidia bacterium]
MLAGASVGAVGLTTATLFGCGDDDDDVEPTQGSTPGQSPTGQAPGADTPTQGPAIRTGGSIAAVVAEPADLNPHTGISGGEHQTLWLIHDNLIGYDEKSVPREELSLAKQWEVVSPTELVLTLRDGVKFHDGTDLTAEVVKYNLELILDPATASVSRGQISPIGSIETPDAKTVVLKLTKPSASLLLALGDRGGMIVSRASLESKGLKDYAVAPTGGSGAFQFETWVRNSNLKLKRNPNYWRTRDTNKLPYLDNLELKFIPEAAVSLAALQASEIQIGPVSEEDLKVVESAKDLSVNTFVGASTLQIFMNRNSPVFKDPRARQALSYAVDRESMVLGITDGRSQPALGPLTPAQWAFDPDLPAPSFDPKKAKQLFESAGFASGTTIKVLTYAGAEIYKRQVELVQQSLREIGITMDAEFVQTGAVYSEYKKGAHDAAFSGFSIRADPHGSLGEEFMSKGGFAWSQNPATLELEPDVDKLLTDANQEYDLEKRTALYRMAQDKIINEHAMVVCMYYGNTYLGQSQKIAATSSLFGGEGKPRLAEIYLKG